MPRHRNEYSHLVPSLLTAPTQVVFDRSINRALQGVKGTAAPLRRVIAVAMGELSARSMDVTAAVAHLGAIVENAAQGGPGDRMSVMTGQPRWIAIRDQVLEDARAAWALIPLS